MYNYALLDPRPVGAAANEAIFAGANAAVMGIEVTIPALAERCTLGNIDPQHGGHRQTYNNSTGYMEACASDVRPDETAIEFAARQSINGPGLGWVATMLPPEGSTLATVRPDLDSVGVMAVLSLLARGESLEPAKERIAAITASDKFAKGGWPGPRPLPSTENPWPEEAASVECSRELAAISAAVADFKVPLAVRVAMMQTWIMTGEEPVGYRDKVETERAEMIRALKAGEIKFSPAGTSWCQVCGDISQGECCSPWAGGELYTAQIAVVESAHRAATMVGYLLAPVVIAFNPVFRVGSGEPHLKYTVCQFAGGYVDLKATLAELSQLEEGWGGSSTIIGSPQGVASTLTTKQVVEVVVKHLIKK